MTSARKTMTVICPVHNEALNLPVFHQRLCDTLAPFGADLDCELLFVNNDSSDDTLAVLHDLRAKDPRIEIITHARNFGYQASVLCGLVHATGDATVIIDADCEDPPEMLATFIERWRQGYDIVYGIRADRPEAAAIKAMRKLFYRLTHHIADWEFIIDMAEFSLFTRRVREQVLRVSSTFPFIRSELAYVGFKRIGIPYARQPRLYGATHYNLLRMTQFAVAGILSASTFPLRMIVYLGALLVPANLLAVFLLADAHLLRLLVLDAAVGLTAAAALSTYVSRIYKDSVGRPTFIVDRQRTTLAAERLFEPKRSRVTS
ncbi:MAG: glycosyltransferase family 2 protein [Rhodospirillales bacterium]|nr:glycosyltransferase family 2 protein [Rhodospirillales bacterium]